MSEKVNCRFVYKPPARFILLVMAFKDRLKTARKAANLTQQQIADALGISPQAISGWERGETSPEQDKLLTLSRLLNRDVAWLLGQEPDSTIPNIIAQDRLQTPGFSDLPIYSSAEGGTGEIIRSTDPVDWQPRPSFLAKVKNAYGLIVVGDSMWPEYRPGDTALVNPNLPHVGGEVYVFYSEHSDGEYRATIKQLRRVVADKWMVTQHNPPEGRPRDFSLSRKEWPLAHRVMGKYARP